MSALTKNLRQQLTRAYLRQLVSTRPGRAHLLSQVADAEGTDEARVFDQAFSKVDDAELQKMIQKHQADEQRHAELFRACEARQGLPPRTVPDHLKLLMRLEKKLGNPLSKPIETREDIMQLYLILQVIEERAIVQFDLFIEAFSEVDPETAEVFRQVKADEGRHLKYCHAISKRYAPDEAARLVKLAQLRVLEAEAYQENQLANMRYTLDNGLIPGRFQRALWNALATYAPRRERPVTPFFAETAHLVRAAA